MDGGHRDEVPGHLHLDDCDQTSDRPDFDHFDHFDQLARFIHIDRMGLASTHETHSNSSSVPSLLPPAHLVPSVPDDPSPLDDPDAFAGSVDPVDFYRSYQDAQFPPATSSNGGPASYSPARNDAMAPATPVSRQASAPRSSTHGVNDASATPPATASGLRTMRSVSSPVDNRTHAAAASFSSLSSSTSSYSNSKPAKSVVGTTRQASVKDLKKRFDQINNTPSQAPPLPSSTSARYRSATRPSAGSFSATHTHSPADATTTTTTARVKSPTNRLRPQGQTQKPTSPQSFASRIAKPRPAPGTAGAAAAAANEQPSNPMTQLSSPASAAARSANGLLFGEILPDQADSPLAVGYGIRTTRPRRTSESNVYAGRTFARSRSETNADVPPASPSDWYRDVSSQQGSANASVDAAVPANMHPRVGHNRSHSDLAGSKQRDIHPRYQQQTHPPLFDPTHPSSTSSLASRLPLSRRKPSDPTSRTSAPSSRATSPAALRRPSSAASRTPRQHQGPPVAGTNSRGPTRRAVTPTSTSTSTSAAARPSRSKPPSAPSTPRSSNSRKPPPSQLAVSASTRLNPYVSTNSSSRLSPTLRSSRPRQPVSSATSSSSSRAGKPPAYANTRSSQARQEENEARRRKIDVGPIDFARRRETIRLAYSKSIRETEAIATRQAAAERRKKELEAAARGKAFAETAVRAQTEAASTASGTDTVTDRAVDSTGVSSPDSPAMERADDAKQLGQPILTVTTDMSTLPADNTLHSSKHNSPTLGIPGTFPEPIVGSPPLREPSNDEPPPSAISMQSVITEFDNEEQTDPPLPDATTNPLFISLLAPPQQQLTPVGLVHERAEYRSPFEDASPELAQQNQFPKAEYRDPFDVDEDKALREKNPNALAPALFDGPIPGSFCDEDEYNNRPFTPVIEPAGVPTPGSYTSPSRSQTGEHDTPRHRHRRDNAEDNISEIPIINETDQGTNALDLAPQVAKMNEEPEYEPKPFEPSDALHTTVLILSRDTDPGQPSPSIQGSSQLSVPEEPSLEAPEDFYMGPSLRDNVRALRDSTFAVSDISDDAHPESGSEPRRTPETSNSLNVPSLLSPANRSSMHSGWTDFSVESAEAREFFAAQDLAAASATFNSTHGLGNRHHSVYRVAPAQRRSQDQDQPQQHTQGNRYRFDSRPNSLAETSDHNYDYAEERGTESVDMSSREPSSLDISRTSSGEPPGPHLPELDTGTNFFVSYISSDTPVDPHVPSLPNHQPPPVPVPSEGRNSSVSASGRPSSSSAYYNSSRPSSYIQSMPLRDDQGSFKSCAEESRMLSPPQPPTTATTQPSSGRVSLDVPRHSIDGFTLVDGEVSSSNGTSEKPNPELRKSTDTGVVSSIADKPAPTKEQMRLVQRQMVIRELVDTEAVFVRDMNIVEEIYKGTAEACPKLDDKTVKLIFRNTDEIIAFHTAFLIQLKEAVASVYTPKGRRSSPARREGSMVSETPSSTLVSETGSSNTASESEEDTRDRQTRLGPIFRQNIDQMRVTHESFLRSSDYAAKRLIQIQEDPTVKVWLNECNEVAKDLTAAWNLDSLLIKPMQRLTKYPNLISQLLQYTPADHPDRQALTEARTALEAAILDINKTKKNFELVGQIVGRKRGKETDVRAGFARAFGKRVDKLQASGSRPPEDPEYAKLNEKFGDDYLRLQVVLRDVEFYTRQVAEYVHEFLQFLSAMELVMRLQPSPYPEIESKWAHFNMSMRDMEKVALEAHLTQVRKLVIEPFEQVIKCYSNPSLAMKKRSKRRLDYERAVQLKKGGKKVDKQLTELVEQYEALNDALKRELPVLSANTEKIGNICLGNFVNIQVRWYAIWKDKVRVVLEEQHHQSVPEIADIVSTFTREFRDMEEHVQQSLSILGGDGRISEAASSVGMSRSRSRPSDLSQRARAGSVHSDNAPSLPTPDFGRRSSGQFGLSTASTASGSSAAGPNPQHYYYYRGDYYGGIPTSNGHARGGSASPNTSGLPTDSSARSVASNMGGAQSFAGNGYTAGRPGTGRSYESAGATTRPSIDSSLHGQQFQPLSQTTSHQHQHQQSSMAAALQMARRDSVSTYNSNNQYPASAAGESVNGTNGNGNGNGNTSGGRPYSGLFHSALPLQDDRPNTSLTTGGIGMGMNGVSRMSSRASSQERSSNGDSYHDDSRYNVLWLAASLFEFNIETKHEAGYPYLTYQAGEIFDVIAEKGELWLAKNQDDPRELVGWIWSKHFAKLADS